MDGMLTREDDRRRQAEARSEGRVWYWGIGCVRCDRYQVRRYVSTGHCVVCQRERNRQWRRKNPEAARRKLDRHLGRLDAEGRREGPWHGRLGNRDLRRR